MQNGEESSSLFSFLEKVYFRFWIHLSSGRYWNVLLKLSGQYVHDLEPKVYSFLIDSRLAVKDNRVRKDLSIWHQDRINLSHWSLVDSAQILLSWIHTQTQSIFSSLSRMRISVFEVMSVDLINRYQNAIPKAMPLHELKKVQLQEHCTLMT